MKKYIIISIIICFIALLGWKGKKENFEDGEDDDQLYQEEVKNAKSIIREIQTNLNQLLQKNNIALNAYENVYKTKQQEKKDIFKAENEEKFKILKDRYMHIAEMKLENAQLEKTGKCLDISNWDNNENIVNNCNANDDNQKFLYEVNQERIRSKTTNKCLSCCGDGWNFYWADCNEHPDQKFLITNGQIKTKRHDLCLNPSNNSNHSVCNNLPFLYLPIVDSNMLSVPDENGCWFNISECNHSTFDKSNLNKWLKDEWGMKNKNTLQDRDACLKRKEDHAHWCNVDVSKVSAAHVKKPEGPYVIKFSGLNKCLDNGGAWSSYGNFDCNNGNWQKFTYDFKTKQVKDHRGKCLNCCAGSNSNGEWYWRDCNDHPDQQFVFIKRHNDNKFVLKNVQHNKCLDVGTTLKNHDCNINNNNQYFERIHVSDLHKS